jgi:hypothetical protein
MSQIYPTLDFETIDYAKIPQGGFFIAFNSSNNGVLSKIDNFGNISSIEGSGSSDRSYDFYYSEESPNGTGTSTIIVGSIWYCTLNGQSYVYVFDGTNYFWLSLSQPGPMGITGDTGGMEPLKRTSEEILSISSPVKGTVFYNTTIDKICIYDGSSWKMIDQQEMQ